MCVDYCVHIGHVKLIVLAMYDTIECLVCITESMRKVNPRVHYGKTNQKLNCRNCKLDNDLRNKQFDR